MGFSLEAVGNGSGRGGYQRKLERALWVTARPTASPVGFEEHSIEAAVVDVPRSRRT